MRFMWYKLKLNLIFRLCKKKGNQISGLYYIRDIGFRPRSRLIRLILGTRTQKRFSLDFIISHIERIPV